MHNFGLGLISAYSGFENSQQVASTQSSRGMYVTTVLMARLFPLKKTGRMDHNNCIPEVDFLGSSSYYFNGNRFWDQGGKSSNWPNYLESDFWVNLRFPNCSSNPSLYAGVRPSVTVTCRVMRQSCFAKQVLQIPRPSLIGLAVC